MDETRNTLCFTEGCRVKDTDGCRVKDIVFIVFGYSVRGSSFSTGEGY